MSPDDNATMESPMPQSQRPVNFLLFITDQHRADHLGAYGNRVVATPNLDALAAAGWRGDEMHVATPICMPNRASLLTGRYPSAHGARHNGIPLDLQSATFVDVLRQAGYRTSLVGKAHFQNMTDNPPPWPPNPADRLAREAKVRGPGRYDQENRNKWLTQEGYDLDYPFYGFEDVDLVDDHSDSVHGHYRQWLRRHHPEVEALIGPKAATPAPDYVLTSFGQAWRTAVPEELYPSAYIADRTIDRLERAGGQPFFIQCSFPDPHHPFTPPGKYWDMYDPDEMELPPSFHGGQAPLPHVEWLYRQRDGGKAVKHTPAIFACTEREAKEALALNYGSITNIDHQIGRVLAALKRLALDNDTVVIFTSDHGDYLGDHQLMLKGPIHYRGLVRVPFIWHDPGQPVRGAGSALASTIDVAPTILERAGVAGFNGIQGKSLLDVMAGKAERVREHLMIEEEGQRVILGFDARIRCRTLRSDRYRLTIYDGAEWGELYDLERDPIEARNLWDDAEHAGVKAGMMQALARDMLYHIDTSPYPDALA